MIILNQLADFLGTWYERHVVVSHITLNKATWRSCELRN